MSTLPQPNLPLPPDTVDGVTPAPVDPTNLPQPLWIELWQLLMDMERADEIPRRYEVKEILKRRLFFRGDQYWWYNNDAYVWMPPNQAPIGAEDYEHPDFQHVTNIVQPYALSLCSVISQNNAGSRFWPGRPDDPNDVSTAKNASSISDKVHRDNDWQNRIDECTYFMCTDGFFGSYTRHIADAERFGEDTHHLMAQRDVPVGDPQVNCPSCGNQDFGSTAENPICQNCGQLNQDTPQETVPALEYAGSITIPRGQTVVTMVPGLQLKRSAWADNQDEFLYLDWIADIHKSKVAAAYPDKVDKIMSSVGGTDNDNTVNTYEQIARRVLYLGSGRMTGPVLHDLGTFRRVWLRPACFYSIQGHSDNEATPCKRCQLLSMFPKGVKVLFFNDVYLESQPESMDEKWETMHTMPGEGQLRETLISSILPVQEQLNDCINLLFEILMYGVPEGFADADTIDFESRNAQGASAGNLTPTSSLGSQSIRDKIMFTPAVEPAAAMMTYINMLFNTIPQFLTGAFPALFGGETGSNDTAQGIAIVRNQALGRIGRAWRRLQVFLANTDAKIVHVFAKAQTENVEVSRETESGEFESDTINLEDIQGRIIAYPEVDSQFPTLDADVRQLVLNLWNGNNPLFIQVASDPKNLAAIFRRMGVTDIEVPGQEQREKTYQVINQLLQEQPIPMAVPQQPRQPGQPPQPPQPPQMIPSVKPDPDVDNLQVAADTAKTWLISKPGLEAQAENPAGYENVKAYVKACGMLAKAQQLQQAIAAQALTGVGPAADLGGAEAMQPPEGHPATQPPGNKKPEGNGSAPSNAAPSGEGE